MHSSRKATAGSNKTSLWLLCIVEQVVHFFVLPRKWRFENIQKIELFRLRITIKKRLFVDEEKLFDSTKLVLNSFRKNILI